VAKDEQSNVQKLVAMGLPEKEAKVYVAALEMGRGTVSQISRKAGVSRTNGYNILDALTEKGLVRVSGKEPKEEYVAESPDKLIAYLERRHDESSANLAKAKEFAPELKSIQKVSDRPQVKFYEGIEGIRQVYEDTLTSHEPIRATAALEDMFAALPGYFPDYYKRRAKKGISIRAIIPKTPMGIERATHDKEEARETAFVPADSFLFTPEINIYDNKVMMASWREKLGIIIESAEIADAMKKIYELAWAEAKRLDKDVATMKI
jgi:sugar-specific transcriptional regulator TrmB